MSKMPLFQLSELNIQYYNFKDIVPSCGFDKIAENIQCWFQRSQLRYETLNFSFMHSLLFTFVFKCAYRHV